MSATVAAALKKIAVAILTDKKLRKAVLGIVLGIIIIVIMPVVAVIALLTAISISTPPGFSKSWLRKCPMRKKQSCKRLRIR